MKHVRILPLALLIGLVAIPAYSQSAGAERVLKVEQPEGKVVYWVLPGPRRIDPAIFGTPQHPEMTGQALIKKARGPVKALLQELPILVGLPLKVRATTQDGAAYTQTTIPTPFSDRGRIVQGQLSVTYVDRQPADTPENPMQTRDEAKLKLIFTDPAGHHYEVQLKRVFMPPIPGYETQGGVLIDGFHHGKTGTGTPLMPRVYTYGAFWGVADLVIDGKVADQGKVTHCMTTNTVRDANYRLPFEKELPLPPNRTIAGQIHHTHCIMLPITVTPQGPKFAPVQTAFTLPNGQKQPFIHIMFEQDQITEARGVTVPKTFEELQKRMALTERK